MSTNRKHFKSGSECPPLKENQLRLYSMRFCPFVHRVQLVLAAKNIPYEEIYINLADAPDWYLKKNPVGEVPLLEWIDNHSKKVRSVPESLIICDYLDNLYPDVRLHPNDPYLRAEHQVLVSRFGNVLSAFYAFYGENATDGVENLNKSLAPYEETLHDKFFGGSKPAMIDYMLWPWFERLPTLRDLGFVLNRDGLFPKLADWVQEMQQDKAVQKVKVPEEAMKKFFDSVRKNQTNYDIE